MATVQGKIIQAFEPRTGKNDRGDWMAQDFLLESYDQPYTRKLTFSVWGADRLQQFNLKVGDDVAVDFDIDAREYQGRYYNSVRAWRITHIQAPVAQAPVAPQAPIAAPVAGIGVPTAAPAAPQAPIADPLTSDPADDLPF